MAEVTTGILGSQGKSREAATTARESKKSLIKKVRTPVIVLLALVIPFLFWWRSEGVESVEKAAIALTPAATVSQLARAPSQAAPKKVHTGEPVWTKTPTDNTFPVGEWSAETPIGVGCSVQFSIPDGVEIEYRFYSREWKRYEPGTSPNASHLRWRANVEGITGAPYTMTCP